jgi:chaperone required for assembly of F1-ATPase
MKRTYKSVTVEPRREEFVVLLDGTQATTPKRNPLALPTQALAEAIAEEWRAQEKVIDPARMPLTRFANTALDRISRDVLVEELMSYGNTDLLLYRAQEKPLAERQRCEWDPLLVWSRDRFATEFTVAVGIAHVDQPPKTLRALRSALERCDLFMLTALRAATEVTGSLVLSLSLAENRLSPGDAFALSQLDERYQAERWGIDPAAEKRAKSMAQELEIAAKFLALGRP